ncbi:GNAT family N-acetyltransferase [Actinocorallia longicatena]|uniref:GNAT family N-acetyltransferase n=2 Tax=Actinocorallia longicatena TaxID=111803 RepID=A0ABP6QKG5_9ACTN
MIRKAVLGDEQALADLDWRTWAPDNSIAPKPVRGPHFFDRFHLPEHFLVGELDGRVVGYLRLIQPVLQPSGDHVRQIQGFAVDETARGRGIGRQLLEEACEETRRQGASRLTLRVLSVNTAARRLYEQVGFSVEGVLRGEFLIDGRYVDDVMMARTV